MAQSTSKCNPRGLEHFPWCFESEAFSRSVIELALNRGHLGVGDRGKERARGAASVAALPVSDGRTARADTQQLLESYPSVDQANQLCGVCDGRWAWASSARLSVGRVTG